MPKTNAFTLAPLLALVALLAAPTLAQEAPEKPSDVEKAVKRRVESWLRERAQKRLACRTCDCVADRVQWCGDCEKTGIDLRRLDKALLRYLRPAFREVEDEERWAKELLQRFQGRWGLQPYACGGIEVVEVVLTRDSAWVTYAPKGGGLEVSCREMWVREGREFYLGAGSGSNEQLIRHPWFVAGTYSVQRLYEEVERYEDEANEPGTTALERQRRHDARLEFVREARSRLVADLGVVVDVRRETTPDDSSSFWYWASVRVGSSNLNVTILQSPDEDQEELERRLATMGVGTRVFVRGRIHDWNTSETERRFELVRIVEGQIEKAE